MWTGGEASPCSGECTDNREQNTSSQICKAQVSVFSKDTIISCIWMLRVLIAAVPPSSADPSKSKATLCASSRCPAPLSTLSLSLRHSQEQTMFSGTESFPSLLHGSGPCIKTERGQLHPAKRPGWRGNPGTRHCCRWRGRSWVRSQPEPSWAGAPLVRFVP